MRPRPSRGTTTAARGARVPSLSQLAPYFRSSLIYSGSSHLSFMPCQSHDFYTLPFLLDENEKKNQTSAEQTGGLVVFSIGVWTLSDKSFMERLLGSNLYVASAAILIATGLVVTIISFLGTLGAYREIRCMLLIFFVILFIIFVVMLVGGILGYIFRSEVDERMHTEMVASIKSYKEDSKVTDAWDSVQRNVSIAAVLIFTCLLFMHARKG